MTTSCKSSSPYSHPSQPYGNSLPTRIPSSAHGQHPSPSPGSRSQMNPGSECTPPPSSPGPKHQRHSSLTPCQRWWSHQVTWRLMKPCWLNRLHHLPDKAPCARSCSTMPTPFSSPFFPFSSITANLRAISPVASFPSGVLMLPRMSTSCMESTLPFPLFFLLSFQPPFTPCNNTILPFIYIQVCIGGVCNNSVC